MRRNRFYLPSLPPSLGNTQTYPLGVWGVPGCTLRGRGGKAHTAFWSLRDAPALSFKGGGQNPTLGD